MFAEAGVTGLRLINVPVGKVWVVRSIDAYANMPLGEFAELYVGDFNAGLTFWWHKWPDDITNVPHSTAQWRGRQAIAWADGAGVLKVDVNNQDRGVDVMITGYELSIPPVS